MGRFPIKINVVFKSVLKCLYHIRNLPIQSLAFKANLTQEKLLLQNENSWLNQVLRISDFFNITASKNVKNNIYIYNRGRTVSQNQFRKPFSVLRNETAFRLFLAPHCECDHTICAKQKVHT